VFEIDVVWALKKLIEQDYKCARSGIAFQLKCPKGRGTNSPFSPSIERCDPAIGYTADNTELVTYMYNCAKNRFTDEEVRDFVVAFAVNNGIVITIA